MLTLNVYPSPGLAASSKSDVKLLVLTKEDYDEVKDHFPEARDKLGDNVRLTVGLGLDEGEGYLPQGLQTMDSLPIPDLDAEVDRLIRTWHLRPAPRLAPDGGVLEPEMYAHLLLNPCMQSWGSCLCVWVQGWRWTHLWSPRW